MKKIENVNFSKIKSIVISNDDLFNVTLNEDETELIIDSFFRPTIVDSNFNEIVEEINQLKEEINKLKKQ